MASPKSNPQCKKKKKTKLNIQSIFVPKTILEVSQRASGEAQIGSSKLVIREGLEIIKFTWYVTTDQLHGKSCQVGRDS